MKFKYILISVFPPYLVCDENFCPEPPMNCTDDMTLVKEKIPGKCCPEWHCGNYFIL